MNDHDTSTTAWIKASASNGGGECVQMRRHAGTIQIRDSKLGDASPLLSFSKGEIAAWLQGAATQEFAHLID